MSKEILAAQSRAEELLLELIRERLLVTKPPSKDDDAREDREAAERGYPTSEKEAERRAGYFLGWWDCYEHISNIIDSHNEENKYRV